MGQFETRWTICDLVAEMGLAIMVREHAREQCQGIARGLGCAGLDSAPGHAGWLSRSCLQQAAGKLAGRQLAARTCELPVESCFRQVDSPNRLKLFGFPTPTAP
jgi:hypothetical protein